MLDEVAKYHKEWVAYATGIIGGMGEDLVQEMYIKLDRQPKEKYYDGGLNKAYIRAAIRNLCYDYAKKKKFVQCEITEIYETDWKEDGIDLETLQELHDRHIEVRQKLANKSFFLEMLYLIYTSAEDPSLRELAKEAGVPLTTIYNDIKNIKKIIEYDLD